EDDVRVLAIVIETAPAEIARRQPLRQLPPGLAAISRLVDAALLAAFLDGVIVVVTVLHRLIAGMAVKAVAPPLPGRCQQRIRLLRMELHVNDASDIVQQEHLVPGLAAVGRLVEAALLAGAIESSERADINDVGI